MARIDPRTSWTGYLIAAGILLSIALALSEPSASSGLGPMARLVFWFVHVASALFIFEMVQIHLGRLPAFERLPPLLSVAIVSVLGAILFAVFNLVLLDRIFAMLSDQLDAEPMSLSGLLEELRNSGTSSVPFWILINSPRLIMIAHQNDTDEAEQPPPRDAAERPAETMGPLLELLSRLPRRIGTDIVAVSAELHYLRVFTRGGEALILMSFGRAVEALGVLPGQPIHRSHWVALAHVQAIESEGGRVLCRLDTGLTLPVSRTYRASLRAALAMRDEQRVRESAEKLATASTAIQ